jgi:hypothetical protein
MIYPILITAALLSVWGTSAFMSVSGLVSVFGGQPLVAGCLAAGMELGKLLAVIHLHRTWRGSSTGAKCFYGLVIAALVAVTAVEVAGFMIQSHQEDTAALTVQRTELDSLAQTEVAIRHRIAVIDDTLDQLPDGYVSRRINERAAAGYDDLQKQLAGNLERQQVLKVALAEAETQAGPIAAISSIIGMDQRRMVILFVGFLVCIIEPLSIGLAVAASMAWAGRIGRTVGRETESAETADDDGRPRQPAEKTAETAKETGRTATPVNQEFMEIMARHNLQLKEIARITGRKQTQTVASWVSGKQAIPEKAMRAMRKWSVGRPAVRLVQRQARGRTADAATG